MSSSSSSKDTAPFPIGKQGKRELRAALKANTDPKQTIEQFQQSHSLHSMMAKAFGTVPRHQFRNTRNSGTVESLDTDSVMQFLSHLGVSQYEVHKLISGNLSKQLEEEISRTKSEEPLLELLKTCWGYATAATITTNKKEFEAVLVALLKQLGPKTPHAVLTALAERTTTADNNAEEEQSNKKQLKHAEIFQKVSPVLQSLCREADWSNRIPADPVDTPQEYLEQVKETLLFDTIQPFLEEYMTNKQLRDAANRPFVASNAERKILTRQRREKPKAIATATSTQTSNAMIARAAAHQQQQQLTSGSAVSQLRTLLSSSSDTSSTAATSSAGGSGAYRPKLLYATLSILMAQHGSQERSFLGGADHLHCTLVADLLLSAGGHLPKAYTHILALARALDDAVQQGILNDAALAKIQALLRLIFNPPTIDNESSSGSAQKKKKSNAAEPNAPTTAVKRQLNRLITAGIAAMKDADPQHVFLNPVTEAIAPGYSKIIRKPMSIVAMEHKVSNNEYNSITDWESDVKLMYSNCIKYNRGNAGQNKWFRGEANRQTKVFTSEIFPQARRLYQNEITKRTAALDTNNSLKRKSGEEGEGPEIVPLEPSTKKRKKDKEENLPSMPALASMLLSDPFVVRIIIARVLRELRNGVIGGATIPMAHSVVPSLLQILHVARWSTQTCAIRGKKYFIPGAGLQEESSEDDPTAAVSYASLRRFIPLLLRLYVEAELDRRVVTGGDLYQAAQSSLSLQAPRIDEDDWDGEKQIEVTVSLVEGALVSVCQPGNKNETSLSVTFPKFAIALQHLSASLLEDRVFFLCLIQALLRHKTKLPRATSSSIVQSWLQWLKKREPSRTGSMTSAAHECLIFLLNEWSTLGNVVLPRDKLLQFTKEAVQAADASEKKDERKFAAVWKADSADFAPVKKQYERMLKQLPEASAKQWKTETGIEEGEMADAKAANDEDKKAPPAVDDDNDVTMKETATD